MGKIEQEAGPTVELSSWTSVGRAPTSSLCLADASVSGTHAVLSWSGEAWTVQDLASTNGTWLDGVRVAPGARVRVDPGARLSFGSAGPAWRLVDDAPPPLRARADDGSEVVGHAGALLLPDRGDPEVVVVATAAGWSVDGPEGQRDVHDGDAVRAGGRAWRLELPQTLASTVATRARPRLAELELRLRVSPDEEHVEAELVGRDVRLPLPPRAWHYTLLTLARARLRDREAGRDRAEEGWQDTEVLARRLGLSGNNLHVQLCRARALVGELGVLDAGGLFERRAGGRVRLGLEQLHVHRGE